MATATLMAAATVDDSDTDVRSVASVDLSAYQAEILVTISRETNNPTMPTPTGGWGTWTAIGSGWNQGTVAGAKLWLGTGTKVGGAVGLDWVGDTQLSFVAYRFGLNDFSGTITPGSVSSASSTSIIPSIGSAASDDLLFALAIGNAGTSWTVEAGWTKVGGDVSATAPIILAAVATKTGNADLSCAFTRDGSAIASTGIILAIGHLAETTNLVVADALHGHTADSVALVQHQALAVADAGQAHTADSVALVQHFVLAIADASHAHAADVPGLVQHHLLAASDALHAQSAEPADLVQHQALATADALHGQVVDNVALVVAGALDVADASHAHAADALELVQHHTLATADALHAHAAAAPSLVQHHVLAAADALHAQAVDNVALAVAGVLAVDDALHGHSAGQAALVQHQALAVADTSHAHSAEAVALTQHHLLATADALHSHVADVASLVQHYALAVDDALHAHLADNLTLAELAAAHLRRTGYPGRVTRTTIVRQASRLGAAAGRTRAPVVRS